MILWTDLKQGNIGYYNNRLQKHSKILVLLLMSKNIAKYSSVIEYKNYVKNLLQGEMEVRKNDSEHHSVALQKELLHDIRRGRYSKDMTLFNVNHMALIHVLSFLSERHDKYSNIL